MATANKVHFGLKNVHYALITYSSSGVPSWGTPAAVPGAVNLTLTKESNSTDFYADDSRYYRVATNNGYSGTLEMADFPVAMRQAIWGQTLTSTGKLLVENVEDTAKEFALMFEIDGDQSPERYCFMRCMATSPEVTGATKADSVEVQTQSCELTVLPVVDPTAASKVNGKTYYRTTADTPTASYSAFFGAVEGSFS